MARAGIGVRVTFSKAMKAEQKKLERIQRSTIRNAMRKAARQSTKETRRKIRDSARDSLPHRGGLDKWAARMPTVSVRDSGRMQGVRIRLARPGADMRALNRGVARHPVFGNKKVWRNTYFRDEARWFERAVEADRPRLVKELTEAIDGAIKVAWRKS